MSKLRFRVVETAFKKKAATLDFEGPEKDTQRRTLKTE